jgi:hypothetical protein
MDTNPKETPSSSNQVPSHLSDYHHDFALCPFLTLEKETKDFLGLKVKTLDQELQQGSHFSNFSVLILVRPFIHKELTKGVSSSWKRKCNNRRPLQQDSGMIRKMIGTLNGFTESGPKIGKSYLGCVV